MYLDPEDKDKIIQYLSDHKLDLIELKSIKLLSKMKDNLYKKYDPSFYDEIDVQYYGACKLVIAEDVGKATGLAADGILYIIDSMGLDNFKEYMSVRRRRKPKTKRVVRGNKNS